MDRTTCNYRVISFVYMGRSTGKRVDGKGSFLTNQYDDCSACKEIPILYEP